MDDNPYRGPNTTDLGDATRERKLKRFPMVTVLCAVGIVGLGVALLLPAQRRAPQAARRSQCMNNLKQLGVALHNYAAAHNAFPPAYTTDAEGNRLHSWRTLILPFLEDTPRYRSIDLTKPWNDPVNVEISKTRVPAYECPSLADGDTRTAYLAVVTPDSCLRADGSRSIDEITDGLRQTLIVIEVDAEHAVPWMMPVDADESVVLRLGPESNLPHDGGMHAVFADGSVQYLDAEMPAAQRRALITAAGDDQAAAEGAE